MKRPPCGYWPKLSVKLSSQGALPKRQGSHQVPFDYQYLIRARYLQVPPRWTLPLLLIACWGLGNWSLITNHCDFSLVIPQITSVIRTGGFSPGIVEMGAFFLLFWFLPLTCNLGMATHPCMALSLSIHCQSTEFDPYLARDVGQSPFSALYSKNPC